MIYRGRQEEYTIESYYLTFKGLLRSYYTLPELLI